MNAGIYLHSIVPSMAPSTSFVNMCAHLLFGLYFAIRLSTYATASCSLCYGEIHSFNRSICDHQNDHSTPSCTASMASCCIMPIPFVQNRRSTILKPDREWSYYLSWLPTTCCQGCTPQNRQEYCHFVDPHHHPQLLALCHPRVAPSGMIPGEWSENLSWLPKSW